MGTLANISGKEAAKAFAKTGWQIVGQVGSHLVMTKAGIRQIYPSLNTKSFLSGRFVP
jgi:predicted RNA binding protein YcfA (HicA-like mRNA interferase family)